MCSTTPDSASWKLPHNFVLKIYLIRAQLQKTNVSPSQKQYGLQAVAQHIQTFTCKDGANAPSDLLVHTDNGLTALSYTNPLHCNISNSFMLRIWANDSQTTWGWNGQNVKKLGLGPASRVGYEHTYQALERSPQSFQYTSLHCAAASHNLECLLYWSASQAAWCTPPVHRCSNARTHNILHACTASNKWGHVPPHSRVLLCWTGSS